MPRTFDVREYLNGLTRESAPPCTGTQHRTEGSLWNSLVINAIAAVPDEVTRLDLRYDFEERCGIGIHMLAMATEDAERIAAGEILKRIADMKGRPP